MSVIDELIEEYTNLKLKLEKFEEGLAHTENYYSIKLKEQKNYYEKLRPHWARGYTSDSVAAQSNLDATLAMWELLEVTNQTNAIAKLKYLSNNKNSA